MGTPHPMKVTVESSDALLVRAKRHARRAGRPLRALIEDGLRHVLEVEPARKMYHLPLWQQVAMLAVGINTQDAHRREARPPQPHWLLAA